MDIFFYQKFIPDILYILETMLPTYYLYNVGFLFPAYLSPDCWPVSVYCWLLTADCWLLPTDNKYLNADQWLLTYDYWLLTAT